MKRDISSELLAWKKQSDRKPLVLKGVRQCGKTYILKEFGHEQYRDFVYFNFEETMALSTVFNQDYDVKRILFDLGLFAGKTITPGDMLIILDEIQECPRAITALKYFCENASQYHIACAGSLLGLAIHENQSFPVGKVDIHTLYPMSFYEFLSATGEDNLS
jgi:predicted AAA+ superfamily ATPase